ncbi:hypothetical protein LEM9268_01511 [Leuconostoc mesenteroides]|nr:hypothetical protein LEM9268_01511 [Leuconostoc mesenteroides]SPE67887.1 hypothetical protein LEM9217_01498 [Leuconostoc mesenteroides]SPI59931.1 hypothetical protein LEM9266_01431 [Leuconostoc mesenteroides]STY37842.1 Uncharacterised protein [Leuconostoc mesenteroides]
MSFKEYLIKNKGAMITIIIVDVIVGFLLGILSN